MPLIIIDNVLCADDESEPLSDDADCACDACDELKFPESPPLMTESDDVMLLAGLLPAIAGISKNSDMKTTPAAIIAIDE